MRMNRGEVESAGRNGIPSPGIANGFLKKELNCYSGVDTVCEGVINEKKSYYAMAEARRRQRILPPRNFLQT